MFVIILTLRDHRTIVDIFESVFHEFLRIPAMDEDAVPIENMATNVRNILQQIAEARNDESHHIHVSADLRTIRITEFARFGDEHFLRLRCTGPHMDVRVAEHSLPALFTDEDAGEDTIENANADAQLFAPIGTVASHLLTFQLLLEQMDAFYACMHTIDSQCQVVEPVAVTTKSRTRTFRISAAGQAPVFVRICVDPLSPQAIVCSIIGPSYATGPFRQLYDERVGAWDCELDVHANLLRIFGVERFPERMADGQQDAAAETCGICLEVRSDGGGQIAFVACDNERCEVLFHPGCLRRWFEQLPEARTFLDVTCGKCPYCKAKLSASFVGMVLAEER